VRLGARKRRKEPRFWVECRPEYIVDSGHPRFARISVLIRNDSDVAYRVDEAAVRYDDGRVGMHLNLEGQLTADIPPRRTFAFTVPAEALLDPGPAARFRVVVYRGRSGQRLEWSSREERFAPPGLG
jgi:hypothetical protein